jgi:hypothetical protein
MKNSLRANEILSMNPAMTTGIREPFKIQAVIKGTKVLIMKQAMTTGT